jgi:hypothetical protein
LYTEFIDLQIHYMDLLDLHPDRLQWLGAGQDPDGQPLTIGLTLECDAGYLVRELADKYRLLYGFIDYFFGKPSSPARAMFAPEFTHCRAPNGQNYLTALASCGYLNPGKTLPDSDLSVGTGFR